jgi:hypothetical protein
MPNPANGSITVEIHLDRPSDGHALDVLDLGGRVVHHERLDITGTTFRETIDLSPLPAGAYVLRLSDASGMTAQRVMLY